MEQFNDRLPTTPAGREAYVADYRVAYEAAQNGIPREELDHSNGSLWAIDASVAAYEEFSALPGNSMPEPDPQPLVPNLLAVREKKQAVSVRERIVAPVERVAAFAGGAAVRGSEIGKRLVVRPLSESGLRTALTGASIQAAAWTGEYFHSYVPGGVAAEASIAIVGVAGVVSAMPGFVNVATAIWKRHTADETETRTISVLDRLHALEERILAEPDGALFPDELSFLYQLDDTFERGVLEESQGLHGIGGSPRLWYEAINRLRELRVDRDREDIAHMLPEAIRGQLKAANSAYDTVAKGLGLKRRLFGKLERFVGRREFDRLFAKKDKEWQEGGVYDYLVEHTLENGLGHTLVATPNVETSEGQIIALAEAFGKEHSIRTEINRNVYEPGRYIPEALSGTRGVAPVQFSLIPNRLDKSVWLSSARESMDYLRDEDAARPNLQLHVPSVLDAITYWSALYVQGGDVLRSDSEISFDKTYISHFDLEPDGREHSQINIPSTCVSGGSARLDDSSLIASSYARLAIG